jgi:hypothetical protein
MSLNVGTLTRKLIKRIFLGSLFLTQFSTCSHQKDLGVPPKTPEKYKIKRRTTMANRYRNEIIEIKLTKEQRSFLRKSWNFPSQNQWGTL